jgi:hypothetical protein
MIPTRTSQPYRAQHGRGATAALASMLRGRSAGAPNPQDLKRTTRKLHSKHLAGLLKK